MVLTSKLSMRKFNCIPQGKLESVTVSAFLESQKEAKMLMIENIIAYKYKRTCHQVSSEGFPTEN